MTNIAHNLYLHVPFCASKCNYCAFYSRACGAPDWNQYCENILGEIEHWYNTLGKVEIPTIFFGGGTPSLMPTDIFAKIMESIRNKFNVTQNCEVTLESNPGTLDAKRLAEFKHIGVNRLSVGVQSLDDNILKFMGRTHNTHQALDLLKSAHDLGLRVSADFIYGLPNQSVDGVVDLCHQINKLGLKHCSMYELSIEPDTPFAKMNLDMPDNETMANMYIAIGKTLTLPRYEVSNYATPGFECQHNLNIWDGKPYIGIGVAAAGRVLIDGQWYEQVGDNKQFDKMTPIARAIEKVIMGLRTTHGTELTSDVRDVIDFEFVNTHPELLTIDNNRIKTTEKGNLILNDLLVNLVR